MSRTIDFAKTLAWETYNIARKSVRLDKEKLEDDQLKLVDAINEEGFAVVPDYYSPEHCAILRGQIDSTIDKHKDKLWIDENTASDYRCFGAEIISDELAGFKNDPWIRSILNHTIRREKRSLTVMAARLDFKKGNLGSGQGWHRDTAQEDQLKAIIYLSDVYEHHGAFQYLRGTHKSSSVIDYFQRYKLDLHQHRFSPETIQQITEHHPDLLKTFTAKQGTLILVNTRGLHRGMPIEAGTRYALTQYIYYNRENLPKRIQDIQIKLD